MQEAAARDVTAVRAIETADRARTLWSDADRAWASRAAAEVEGESAAPLAFLARRASLALERLSERNPAVGRVVRAFAWRRWITPVTVASAFVAGVAVDQIGSGGRVNILAPPALGLLAWNLVVYALLAAKAITGVAHGGRAAGPLQRIVGRLAGASPRLPKIAAGAPLSTALASFAADWSRLAAPLYTARAARVLHLAAAAMGAGVITGLYLRGIAFEYRATWQSTFLDAEHVRGLLAWALAPGSLATGIPVPPVGEIASIRSSGALASENAARWLHLYAATLLIVVIGPRLALAAIDGWIERRRARRLPVALDEPYFRRLLRGVRGGPVHVQAIPYSYAVPPAAAEGLASIVERAFGARSRLTVAPAVAYGSEDSLPSTLIANDAGTVIALFNVTATPEIESHGAFVTAVAHLAGRGRDLFALVDESAYRARWPDDEHRLAERRAAWRDLLYVRRVPALFADLGDPDLAAAEAAIEAVLEASPR